MAELNIGLRQARRLAEMPPEKRLAFIAEGLPIILESATSLLTASKALPDHTREADILRGFAEEEAAKALVLIDIVRCPPKLASQKIATMIRWFYDHLARLLYAEAAHMRPVTTAQLQEYVDHHRKTHYLEGDYGQYILPNSKLFSRESKLYADIAAYEDKDLFWSAPSGASHHRLSFDPAVYNAVQALAAVGAFSPEGLAIIAEVWGAVDFRDSEGAQESDRLIQETVKRFIVRNLPRSDAKQDHIGALYQTWQFPMYNIDLRKIEVSMDELSAERDILYPY